ncbi:MAG: flagellar motor stator protein MotA [Gammaproteobacteria bacterium]|mgnify:FL=1|jgi:chemotaxis protein MotA|nr:flagellar motor stator protein MotA [Gammaproteobacteria bacterium]MBT4607293.1 flagellar motor stator protein MotA [Thiotrichales bacterium]MBT3473862.1 flagellar motor stator protein MotA [Gammaproteobacteria bacterium]MBT3892546.1 flagellar motor stator protein MotA [Gammaproteobacteria bacterium]MBT3966188.1 flagellar motor stator protein MotA [Gammaproteobacteria bacterium]
MNIIFGFFIVVSSVIGGYMLSHGYLLALWQPYELLIILGAATGGLVIANPPHILGRVRKGLPQLLRKSRYDKALYLQLLSVIYELFMRSRKNGMLSLETHVEEPDESFIFQQYPRLMRQHSEAITFLVDYLRLIVGGNMNSYELDNLMDIELATHEHEASQPSGALSAMADGLPGFGIVAAVMGIVITMGSLGGPVEETGQHLAAALVGTFLGILLSYGFVGPLARALQYIAEDEAMMLNCIKTTLVASLNGYAPVVAVEFGRKAIPARLRPGFYELEDHIHEIGLHDGAVASQE